ncbi:MAG TPA: hypothetical protein VIH82_14635 [Acidimicrobiia bacterium]|jgi:hypothetical protein
MRFVLVALATLTLLAAGCGGGGDGDNAPRVIEAGQVDAKLPAGYRVESPGDRPSREVSTDKKRAKANAAPSSTLPGQSDATTPTTAKSAVPIKKSGGAIQDLIAASGKFRDCLNSLNVKFIGAPDASNPQSPTNDPDYIKSLSTCAARSNIIQYVNAAKAEQDTWTPKEIKRQNEGYVLWRECMVKRGWKIDKPTPDEKGRLFVISTSSKPPEPPPGKDFFNSKDQSQCAAQAQKEYKKKHHGHSLTP